MGHFKDFHYFTNIKLDKIMDFFLFEARNSKLQAKKVLIKIEEIIKMPKNNTSPSTICFYSM